MAKFYLSNKAIEDIDAIWLYTLDAWSESQADDYYHDLVSACQHIADHPAYLDKEYSEILSGLYCHRCRKHLIFYILIDDGVEIVRILHERMDIETKFDV